MNKADIKVLSTFEFFKAGSQVTRHQLHDLTNFDDRTIRASIHRLRNAGHHIISDPSQSGYWMGTDDEWNDFCDRERRAALNRLHRKTWENGRQLKIEVEG
jgi:hypothetical protein